jgi:four helix bundle protein
MTQTPPPATTLPHHKLFAYELCLSLVKLVAKTRVADAQLRAQARKSAASAALNCAEGAARQTRADKSRAYAIALCECCEACAAIEIGSRRRSSSCDIRNRFAILESTTDPSGLTPDPNPHNRLLAETDP